jgi:CheY-like chemotaxis protein
MATHIHPVLKIPPRILIVDNDSRTCESLYELLSHWGYTVVIAEGDGEELLKDAQRKAREFCCQVAIVDMRLIDDFDRDDKSGLDLVEKLKPTTSIVMSGYGDDQTASESLEEKGAVSFIGKQWAPEILKQKLEKVIHSICANKKNLVIEPFQVVEEVIQIVFRDVGAEFRDQFADVLTRLFPTAHHLRIERLGRENDLSDFSTAPRPASVVLKVYEKLADEELQPVIVKLARAEKIEKEVFAYRNFVRRRLVGLYKANLEASIVLWDIGGAIYEYFGNLSVTPFYQYARLENLENTRTCLRNFFFSTWSEHYRKAKVKSNVSLFEMYCDVWGKKWYERALELKEFDPAMMMGGEFWRIAQAPHPIGWLISNVADNKIDDVSRIEKACIAVTHGDLHGDNLLVDENHNAWVIDFERCGEGHILQDFIELETDIINRINTDKGNFHSFFQLCLAVTTPMEIQAIPVDDAGLSDPDIRKSLEIISMIRALAYETTGVSDAREYMLGLLFNSIFRATIIPKDKLSHSQHRALMLASIICHRLDHWNDPWPPEEWRELK